MNWIGKFVVVRTYSAGVHMGYLEEWDGKHVILRESRRLFEWHGAFTLNEVAENGVAENSRISQPVSYIGLTEAIEVIPCQTKAEENLKRSRHGA